MFERVPMTLKGEVSVFRMDRPDEVLYQRKNVIVNNVSYLFARLFTQSSEPVAGVWGLAVGAGGTSPTWSASQQPAPTPTQIAMVSEIKRKQLATVQYLDPNKNPIATLTDYVGFLTVLNATTDHIETPIREMGLIGGGTTNTANGGPTDMLTAPYFDPTATPPVANTVILINYVTTPAFILPAGVDMGVLWRLQF